MMTIKADPIGGVQISIGIGKTFKAKNIEELHQAIGHYFKSEFNLVHKMSGQCPLCRD